MATSTRLTARQGRKFAFTLGIALVVLGGLSLWRGHDIVPFFLLVPGAMLFLAGILAPTRLGPVERRWMAFGHFLSRFMSPIVLGVLYFGVLTPFGLAMRLFGKNPLAEHHRPETTWTVRHQRHSHLPRQY